MRDFFCYVTLKATDLAITQVLPWWRSVAIGYVVGGHKLILSWVAALLVDRVAPISSRVFRSGVTNIGEGIPATGVIGGMRSRWKTINELVGFLERGFKHQ